MNIAYAPSWLRRGSPPPASQNHFNHCLEAMTLEILYTENYEHRFKLLKVIERNLDNTF